MDSRNDVASAKRWLDVRVREPIRHVVVVVPAHNEQERIVRNLDSVVAAGEAVADLATYSIVVVADACSDTTLQRASLRLSDPPHRVIQTSFANVGAARRAGTRAGLRRLGLPLQTVWVASTDADSLVPADWLKRQLRFAARGCDGVAGVVSLTNDHDCDPLLQERFEKYYTTNDDGSHDHVHGANLGVRADAYAIAGGWTALATGEEHDLWSRLRAHELHLESSADLVVATSARRQARAPAGFAADLVALDKAASNAA